MKRILIKISLFCLTLTGFVNSFVLATTTPQSDCLSIQKTIQATYRPLQPLTVKTTLPGKISVMDGKGDIYFSAEIKDTFSFRIGGALGTQQILLLDKKGRLLDQLFFEADCKTEINDESGTYRELLDILYHSMTGSWKREADIRKFNDRYYHTFVSWLRDHVHALKGMKYYYPEIKTGIDLYADSQREDGMIWDNYTHPPGSYWEQRFRYGEFVKNYEGNNMIFTRIPVENDVEYLFIEGIYYTWKASGDTDWMLSMLDNALKAVEYSTTSPYRWSDKHQLLKRGYTIDTWDFQNDEDAAISVGPGNLPDPMIVTTDHTRFGIMYGDNTGMIASLRYLAEMLQIANRIDEAEKMETLARDMESRLNKLCWNGSFYTHHVPEDESLVRDLGVDEKSQVSLSNAYSLNRGISHEKVVEVIKTYQKIRDEMPESSPGEFYTIYPPFETGYGSHNSKWNYMNGGVISIVAGELAHGAFEHGFESYGVDILNRQMELAKTTDNYLHCTYRGKMPEEPKRNFSTISLHEIANTDFVGETLEGVMGWTNEGTNDLHAFPPGMNKYNKIPFEVINPDENNRRACLGLSNETGYTKSARIEVGQKAKSLYLLHTTNQASYCGNIVLHYSDGSTYTEYLTSGKVTHWWYPEAPAYRKQMPRLQVAWVGKNDHSDKVGVGNYGINNPHPEKIIDEIVFHAAENGAKWMVLGLTLSDYEVLFMPEIISGGIPDNWGAAAVVYALTEGLAGVVDKGVAFDKALLAPRWEAANERQVSATIKYESSGGYVAYTYRMEEKQVLINFTGTATSTDLQVLLPENKQVKSVLLNEGEIPVSLSKIEESPYLNATVHKKGIHTLRILFE